MSCCRVRWTVRATPRLSRLFSDGEPILAEAISTYTFDSNGYIYEHQVDRIIPPESPVVRFLEWFVAKVQGQQQAEAGIPLPGVRGLRDQTGA